MAFVAVLLAIVAVLSAVAGRRALQRRRADEIRSIHHYHERLDTLHIEQHDRGGSVRLVDGELVAHEVMTPTRPRLDPATARLDDTTSVGSSDVGVVPPGRHGREWALGRSEPRARIDTATILVVIAVVAGLLVLGIAGYLIQHDRGTSTTTTTVAPSAHALSTPSRASFTSAWTPTPSESVRISR
jgi:hypothetical protein